VVRRTAAGALSAFLRVSRQNPALSPARNSEIHPDNFYATAWLCTEVNGTRFRAYVGIKRGFSAQSSRNNGERARSLLGGREAMARPAGVAVLHRMQKLSLCESCPQSEWQENFVRTKFRGSGRA